MLHYLREVHPACFAFVTGNWSGEGKFKMWFNHGGAIEFGQAMLHAGRLGNYSSLLYRILLKAVGPKAGCSSSTSLRSVELHTFKWSLLETILRVGPKAGCSSSTSLGCRIAQYFQMIFTTNNPQICFCVVLQATGTVNAHGIGLCMAIVLLLTWVHPWCISVYYVCHWLFKCYL